MTTEDARRILNFWEVIDRLDPLPDPWRQTAMTCFQVEKMVAAQYASAGAKYEITKYEDFMPPQYSPELKPQKRAKKKQTADDQIKALEGRFKNG